jgi:hypothetical protein
MTRDNTRMLENYVMPKVLVLFDSGDQRAAELAQLAAEGAKNIRFTEVDLRVVGIETVSGGTKRKQLESSESVIQYDGVVVVGSDREPSAAISALLAAHPRGEFVDRVFAAVSNADPSQRLSALGGILVGMPAGSTDLEATARKTGERVAKVAEWVRHALGHEHGHSHDAHSQHRHSH